MKYAPLYVLRAISFLRCVLRLTMPFAIHCKRLVTHYAMNKIPSSRQRNVTLTALRYANSWMHFATRLQILQSRYNVFLYSSLLALVWQLDRIVYLTRFSTRLTTFCDLTTFRHWYPNRNLALFIEIAICSVANGLTASSIFSILTICQYSQII